MIQWQTFHFLGVKLQSVPIRTLKGHSDWINQVLFAPGDRLVSCSDDKSIIVWDIVNGQIISTLNGHLDYVLTIALLPNGWLASGSADRTIRFWDLETGLEVKKFAGYTDNVMSLQVLKHGNLASFSQEKYIKIWNPYLESNNLILSVKEDQNAIYRFSDKHMVAFHKDGGSILSMWDTKNGQLVSPTPSGQEQIVSAVNSAKLRVNEVAARSCCLKQISDDILLSCHGDGGQISINLRFLGRIFQTIKTDHTLRIDWVDINRSRNLVATASRDKSVKLWSIEGVESVDHLTEETEWSPPAVRPRSADDLNQANDISSQQFLRKPNPLDSINELMSTRRRLELKLANLIFK